ncbi:MAG: hypothetical protein AB7I38_10990 [Dehalococcoidia bacterium]
MSGDFGGLRGIVEEARTLDEENANRPLVDCPICGTPLDRRDRDGLANCPMGHFTTSAPTQGG